MRSRLQAVLVGLIAQFTIGAGGSGPAPDLIQLPDVRVVAWTVDDSTGGNGDGGLQPGEEADLVIYLANRGNEPARDVIATLSEAVDHPDVEIVSKVGWWMDLPATGGPAPSLATVRIRVATTRPCAWEIPLRLEIFAAGGYYVVREFALVMVDPQRVDLEAGKARPFYFGADNGDGLGISVASGDLDGDGFDDLVFGAPFADGPFGSPRAGAGEVVLVYGDATRRSDVRLSQPQIQVTFIYGANADDFLGASVATGDLNGDGFDDLILAAPQGDGPFDTDFDTGEVIVIYGKPSRHSNIDLIAPPSDVDFIYGVDDGDTLGFGLAAGDINGDGFDDLILGAPNADAAMNVKLFGGDVAIVYGGPGPLGDIELASPTGNVAFILGADEQDNLGTAVAAGDIDGDGIDDLVLGSSGGAGPGETRPYAGEVTIVYGATAHLQDIDLASPPPDVAVIYGASEYDELGGAVATGDVDGDGFIDLVLGAPYADGPGGVRNEAGEVVLIPGHPLRLSNLDLASPPADAAFYYGIGTDDHLGWSVATGDVDGDGFEELILGAPQNDGPGPARIDAGQVFVVPGGERALSSIDFSWAPADVRFVYGATAGDQLGFAVAAADVDGDGFDDLVLGGYLGDGQDDTRIDAGEVAILPGEPVHRYRHDPDAFAFIDATTGTDLGLACDDCGATIPIGFTFDFYGRKHDQLTVSSNGYLTFGGGPASLPVGSCPPRTHPPNSTIAVFWDDLNPAAGGAIYSLLEGTAPFRRLTIQWDQVPLWPAVDAATFEVTLFESTDQIVMQYQDVDFGGTGSDFGGTAIAGVESGNGANGTALVCDSAALANGQANRFRRFARPTVVYADDVEPGIGNWEFEPLWHRQNLEPSDCGGPATRSGEWAWYYGQDGSCNYETGATNAGRIGSDNELPDLAQDAALSFWHRRQTEVGAAYDQSFVGATPFGGPTTTLVQVLDTSNVWRYSEDFLPPPDGTQGRFAPLDLSPYVGQDVILELFFDTIDAASNTHLGWMIDDIEVRGCPVYDAGTGMTVAAAALATAQPDLYCEGRAGRVDALGSYCAACPGLDYQWSLDGAPLPGATAVAYDIPSTETPGVYDYSVGVSCAVNPGCAAASNVARVEIVQEPAQVGPTLMVGIAAGSLEFTWIDVAGADDYVLRSDVDPGGGFATIEAIAGSGTDGVTVPVPGGDLVIYRVAGRNPVCGEGTR